MNHIRPMDVICIEGFGFASQQAIQLGGIGWGIRMALYGKGIKYTEVSPPSVKKFATGKGKAKKDEMVLPIYRKWGFEHRSDNVRDAFVLAQIARAINDTEYSDSLKVATLGEVSDRYTAYQLEVIHSILNPSSRKKKRKRVAK